MNHIIKKISLILILLTVLNGCTNKNNAIEEISEKRALLPKLTGKVKAGILEGVSSENLSSFIKEEFPETFNKFSNYSVFIKSENDTAVVLICNKEKTKALLEDASCHGYIEGNNLYEKELPCQFHLPIDEICNKY